MFMLQARFTIDSKAAPGVWQMFRFDMISGGCRVENRFQVVPLLRLPKSLHAERAAGEITIGMYCLCLA